MQITRVQHLHALACNAKLAGSRLLGSKIRSEGLGRAAAVQPPFPTWSSHLLSKNKTAFGTPSYSNAQRKEFRRSRLFKVTFVWHRSCRSSSSILYSFPCTAAHHLGKQVTRDFRTTLSLKNTLVTLHDDIMQQGCF